MTNITTSLFLISKCSRITSLQSLFFNFLESNVLLSLGQCMNCFLVSKTIRVFSHSHIKYRFHVSPALFLRFALCAWHLGKGALSPIIRASRFASFPSRLALQNKRNTNPSIFCGQIQTPSWSFLGKFNFSRSLFSNSLFRHFPFKAF